MKVAYLPLFAPGFAMATLALVVLLPAAHAAAPELREAGGQAEVVWQGEPIVQLGQGRRLWFRASGDNDRWVGSRGSKMDLCWSYGDVNDYVFVGKSFHATDTDFVLELDAEKPSVRGRVHTRLEGRLVSPEVGFKYILSSKLTAAQKEWREVSHEAKGRPPTESLGIEALDFHINRISPSDNFRPGGMAASELYDGFVLSSDGQNWRFIPKIPVPEVIRPGAYPTVRWNAERAGVAGHRVGWLDRREGGWMSELLDASVPLQVEMCWMFYDLHHLLPRAIPPWTGGADTFEVRYSLAFIPVSPARARELLDQAAPLEWRSRPEYQLPVFSRYSTFDRLISRNSEYAWLASDYDCAVDATTGYDDHCSIRIRHAATSGNSAWYGWTWGPCYDSQLPLEGAYRFSAMVKTENCDAPFRLAVAEFLNDLWLSPDEKWCGWPDQPNKAIWHYSTGQVTGTTDWTRLTVDLKIDHQPFQPELPERIRRSIVLQYQGKGTVWIDNVRIMKIE